MDLSVLQLLLRRRPIPKSVADANNGDSGSDDDDEAIDWDEWHVAADDLIERESPVGAWLATRLAALKAMPGSPERVSLERHANVQAPHSNHVSKPTTKLRIRQELLLALSVTGELAPIVEAINRGRHESLAFNMLGTTAYYPCDELFELDGLVAEYLHAILFQIELGTLTVTPLFNGSPRQCVGYLEYAISNGWRLEIYDRVFEWHYVAKFTSPEGVVVDLTDHTSEALSGLMEYEPPAAVLASVYGFT